MAFWLCDQPVRDLMKPIVDEHHEHLQMANIALMFSDKRKVSGNRIVLGTTKKVSDEDRILSKYDFKMIFSAEDWADLTEQEKKALLDHELSHCDIVREPMTELIGGKKKPIKDKYGRTIFSDEPKVDEETGRMKYKIKGHDFENFVHIAERYGTGIASTIGGYFPIEKPITEEIHDDDTPPA